jgi:transcriptional regulator with XRE-family HTH domain
MTQPDWTAERIKGLRTRLGLSQHEFALRVGVTVTAISHWETGRRSPDYERRLKLDRLLRGTVEGEAEGSGTTQAELLEMIRREGIQPVAALVSDLARQTVVGFRDGGVNLLRWQMRQIPGAILFYRVDAENIITGEPRILWVNAPESERAKWEAIAAEFEEPTTVVMRDDR